MTSETLTDSELRVKGFQILANGLGELDAERFIALTIREPQDYTAWRKNNLFVGESIHSIAEFARAVAAEFSKSTNQ